MDLTKKIIAFLCCCAACCLLGCSINIFEKPEMLDGPGMEYAPQWEKFVLSRTDSYVQYNFWFSVSDDTEEPLLTGECFDEKGNQYIEEEGIPLSGETIWALRWMDLEKLEEEVPFSDDLEPILDDSEITLTLVLADGKTVKKNISGELAMEIYQLLLPYFTKS